MIEFKKYSVALNKFIKRIDALSLTLTINHFEKLFIQYCPEPRTF